MSDRADDAPLSQEDIDAALAAAGMGGSSAATDEPTPETVPADAETADSAEAVSDVAAPDEPGNPQAAIDEILSSGLVDAAGNPYDEAAAAMAAAIEEEKAQSAKASAGGGPAPLPEGATPLTMPDLNPEGGGGGAKQSVELLRDVDLHVKIELGRTRMRVEDVLALAGGAVVELDKLAGDPVDVLVNDRLVARGEVLVLNDNFCVRINEIVSVLEEVV